MADYWFKRRRFGYGWTPSTWQGWLVLGLYLIVVFVFSAVIMDSDDKDTVKETVLFLAFLGVATILLLLVTIKEGPKPKWRMGSKPTDNPEEDF